MRWFLTDDVPDLAARITAAGEQVVSEPSDWVAAHLDRIRHPQHYLLRALVEPRAPDVVVLVNPLQLLDIAGFGLLEFGYFVKMTQALRRHGVKVVLLATEDPQTWQRFAGGMAPKCICRPTQGDVYVSSDPATADAVKGLRLAAYWRPGEGIGQVLAAVAYSRSRQTYQPKRDRGLW